MSRRRSAGPLVALVLAWVSVSAFPAAAEEDASPAETAAPAPERPAPDPTQDSADQGAAPMTMLTAEELAAQELARKRNAPPVLECSPQEIIFPTGDGETRPQQVVVRNGGGQVLKWAVSSAPEWVNFEPPGGELGYEEERALVLAADPKGLPGGRNEGTMTIEAAGAEGSPAAIGLAVDVEAPAVEPAEPEEVVAEPEPEPPLPTAPPRQKRFSVRIACVLPGDGKERNYDTNATFGAYYTHHRGSESRLSYEFGVDVGAREESDEFESTPYRSQVNAVYSLGGSERTTGYLVVGAATVAEQVSDTLTGREYSNLVGALNLGGGVLLGEGSFDVRAEYNVFFDSKNLPGQFLIAVGYCF